MTLDEAAFSDVSDVGLEGEIRDTAYHGADIRPAWIGSHRPRTNIAGLNAIRHWADVHYDYYLNFVRDFVERRGDILDIGCGAGQSTSMLARYADSAIGMDIDATVIAFANKHNAGRATFQCGSFPEDAHGTHDYIFCIETIEHVPYERQDEFLDRALGMLRPGGRMFITTPNEQSAGAPHVGVWSTKRVAEIEARLGERIVRRAYFSNQAPTAFLNEHSTHHAWVLR